MKTTIIGTLILLIGAFGLSAQATDTRDVSSYSGVQVSAGIDAILVKGNTNSVKITAKGIDIDKVTTKISRDVLKVGIEQSWWSNMTGNRKRKVSAVITYTDDLEYISSSSGASLKADHTIESRDLELSTSSGAYLTLDVDCRDLEIDLSSGSEMDLAGTAQDIEIDLSSGAILDAYGLKGEHVDIDGSSGASARVTATDLINADVSSGASVRYKGSPRLGEIDKSSGGSVRKS